uniref:Matrix protein n=1 Tax=Pinctada fucata TaxID=50426 RepID=V5XVQ5_PINFU|nr:matrix protein [Pinctada fucata]
MVKYICIIVVVLGLILSCAQGQYCPRDRLEVPGNIFCRSNFDCPYYSYCETSGPFPRCCHKCPIGSTLVQSRCNNTPGLPRCFGRYVTCERDPVYPNNPRFDACCFRFPFYG